MKLALQGAGLAVLLLLAVTLYSLIGFIGRADVAISATRTSLSADAQRLAKSVDAFTATAAGSVKQIGDSVKAIQQHTDRNLIVLGATLIEVQKASKSQSKYWDQSGKAVVAALDQVNNDVLPATTAAINESKAAIRETKDSIRETNVALQPSLKAVAETLNDPAIQESLTHIDAATGSLAAAAAHVDEGVAIGVHYEQQLIKPARLAMRVLLGVASVMGKFLGL